MIALVLAACGGGGPARLATVTPGPGPPTTTAIATTTTATAVCVASGDVPAAGAGDVAVNADGEGVRDRLRVYPDPAGADRPYFIQLILDDRYMLTVRNAFTNVPVAAIGGIDVNGDGRDELFVETGNGAYTTWIDVFEFDARSCKLVRLASPGPEAAQGPQFVVGASTGGWGLVCKDGTFVSTLSSRISDEPLRYLEHDFTYAIEGTALRLVSDTERVVEEPVAAAGFECDGLRSPPGR